MWAHFEYGLVFRDSMSFKDISYLELRQPVCLAEPTICAIL